MDKIDSSLRLVLPLRSDDTGNTISWAYHTPLSMQAFEANYRILASAKGAIFAKGGAYAYYSGVHVAALHLRDAAKQDAIERGEGGEGNASALLAELHRLTMVAVPSDAGFESVPLDVAKQRGAVDDDDVRDVENALVFFTCAYFLTSRAKRKSDVGIAVSALGASTTSLPLTGWIDSLRKSTKPETSETAV